MLELYLRFWFWPNFVIGVTFCIGLPNFVKNRTTLGGVVTSYRFFFQDGGDMRFDLSNIRLQEVQFLVSARSSISLWSWIGFINFGDIAIFIFRHFRLKLPIPGHFLRVWGHTFPKLTSLIVLTPKGTSLRGNTSFEPQSGKIGSAVRPGRVTGKRTGQGSQKSHGVVIFRLFGEKPPLYQLKPKWLVVSPTKSRVQSFRLKF